MSLLLEYLENLFVVTKRDTNLIRISRRDILQISHINYMM